MKRTLVVAAVALATVSSIAIAEAATRGNNAPVTNGNIQQEMLTNLSQSGFSDVTVVPGSFYVHARDSSGNPVSMFITPNSMEEVTTVGVNNNVQDNNVHQTAMTTDNSNFATIPSTDELSSKVIGLDVYNNDNKDIGTIKDIAINSNGDVKGYILSVGGFLGIGDHYVAVKPSAISLSYNATDAKWHAKMDANAGQLKSAPEYKYPTKA
ncbi:MAG: PRC-barrel domain-containing protein [Proteobacteria bacterium]|nr:PRC-barrel domain-containing protein [Pseudomonadota bacterium]